MDAKSPLVAAKVSVQGGEAPRSQASPTTVSRRALDASRITVIGLSHTPVTDAQVDWEFGSAPATDSNAPHQRVGTRRPRKNLPTLLAAYEQMRGTDLDLVLVGPAGWGSDPTDAPGAACNASTSSDA